MWLDSDAGATLRVVYGGSGLSAIGDAVASGSTGASFTGSDFRGAVDAAAYGWGASLQLGDVNGDGLKDIVYLNGAGTGFQVVYGSRDFNGGFDLAAAGSAASTVYGFGDVGGGLPTSLAVGDLTGDGLADLVFGVDSANSNAGAVYLMEGSPGDGITMTLGTAGADVLTGSSSADRLVGGMGADTLTGGAGDDVLIGGAGADVYAFAAGSGSDIVDNRGHGGDGDICTFGGVSTDQLWFRQVGNDLEVSVIGTADKVLVDDWYLSDANHVSQFQTAVGATLAGGAVDNLVSAMAAFTPPPIGQLQLSTAQHEQLDTVLAANWHSS